MKKSLLALAALSAFAGAASAQSSVTLFGIVDVNARSVTNTVAAPTATNPGATASRRVSSLSTDGIASSRLGFRGVEDIGGGMRAGFWLEGALSPDNGNAAGQTWQRRSTVSLIGGFGEIRLGRDYTPDFWNHTLYDPFGTNGVGNSTNTFFAFNTATTVVRANNTIGYLLPNLGGVFGQVQVSAAEGENGQKSAGFRIGYGGGPVNVALSWGRAEVNNTGFPTAEWTRINLGGSFRIGSFMTLMAQYNRGEGDSNRNPAQPGFPAGTADNNVELNHYLIGAVVPFGASTIKFSYVRADTKDDRNNGVANLSNRDASQIAFGYQYDLSKRTALYANAARISNKNGTTARPIGGTFSVPKGGTLADPATGKASTGVEFGVRHSF
jgi:predicted porin